MIAIVGGGISGLAAAYELSIRKAPFVLLEASSRLGGLIHTQSIDGYTIEAGADSMLAQKRTALDLVAELGLAEELITVRQPRTAYVLHQGRLYPLPSPSVFGVPLTTAGLVRFGLLSPLGRARLAMEPLIPRGVFADESIAAFFRRRFGREAVERLAQPLLGGIHAGDIETLSLRTLAPRLASVEQRGSVLRWLRRTTVIDSHGPFRSFASGMGSLVEAIRGRLPAGAVRLDCAVSSVRPGWRLDTSQGSVECDAVVMAAPAYAAARMLRDVDAEAAGLCAQTAYVSTVSLALAWPREAVRHPLNGTGFVVARVSNALHLTACTWVSSKFEGRAPAGKVLLRAYMGGAHDPVAVDRSDDELVGTAVRELSRILSIAGPPELARVYRWRHAGAQHDVGQAARIETLQGRLSHHRVLFVTGSGFKAVGVPDCIADGRRAAIAAIGQV